MNSLIETEFPLHEAQHLRYDLLRVLTDSDLAYQLPVSYTHLDVYKRQL